MTTPGCVCGMVGVEGGGGQGHICLPAAVRNSNRSPPPLRTGQKVINSSDTELLKVLF